LKLEREAKGNKKGFYTYTGSRKQTNENVGSLLSRVGNLVTRDMEEAQVLNAGFLPVFIGTVCPLASQVPEPPSSLQGQSSTHGRRRQNQGALNPLRHSHGTSGMHPRVLEELANVTAMLLTLLKCHGSFKERRFLKTTKRQTLHPSSGKARRSI